MKAEKSTLDRWNSSAKNYANFIRESLKTGSQKIWTDLLLRDMPERKLKILDVGTGPGFFPIILTMAGHDVIGVDVTPGMVDEARNNAGELGLDINFACMNANQLYFPDESFDMVINRNVTWTLPDVFECYEEWKRVLVPGGKLLIFDSNFDINFFDPEMGEVLRNALRRNAEAGTSSHTAHSRYMIRETYWETRPMIGTPRPEWDRNMLMKLRFRDVRCETDILNDTSEDSDTDSQAVAPMFSISAVKPSAEEEAEMILQEYWNPLSACFGGRTVRQYRDGSLAEGLRFLTGIIPRGSKVLDCGCGAGTVSVALTVAGYSAEGIDSSQWMVDEARRTAETLGLDIRYTLGRMEELPFEDGTFDAVVFRNSLYASDDPETALSEAKRVLRDGGFLVIEDGNWVATIDHLKKTDYLRGVQAIDARTDLGFGGTDVVDSVLMAKPLSSESRPYWDVAKLEELGFSDIDCSEADDILLAPGEEFVGRGFVVKSVKWSQAVE